MTTQRSRRVEAMLGKNIEDLTWEDVSKIVEGLIEEGQDLEFKSQHYVSSDYNNREFAKDVAAFANTTGGVIVIGIVEDNQGRATNINPVSIVESESLRYRQILASRVQPLVSFTTHPVPSVIDPNLGVLFIVIPRSNFAPHCLLVDTDLRFPSRYVKSTNYLQEKDLANAYRERLILAQSREDLMHKREQEFLSKLGPERLWLVVTLVPDFPGVLVLDRDTQRELELQIRNSQVLMPWVEYFFERVEVGHRRMHATDSGTDGTDLSEYCGLELHTDGSGCFAVALNTEASSDNRRIELQGVRIVMDEQIVDGLISSLKWLGNFAWTTGAEGLANLRARIWPINESAPVALAYEGTPIFPRVGKRVSQSIPCDVSVPLDQIYKEGPDLVQAAGLIVQDVSQAMRIVDIGYIDHEGKIRYQNWQSQSWNAVKGWCEKYGIDFIEGTSRW